MNKPLSWAKYKKHGNDENFVVCNNFKHIISGTGAAICTAIVVAS
jgi:hypothetical protein